MERQIIAGQIVSGSIGYNRGEQAGGERGADCLEKHGQSACGASNMAAIGRAQRYNTNIPPKIQKKHTLTINYCTHLHKCTQKYNTLHKNIKKY